jgi:hypothetical protein
MKQVSWKEVIMSASEIPTTSKVRAKHQGLARFKVGCHWRKPNASGGPLTRPKSERSRNMDTQKKTSRYREKEAAVGGFAEAFRGSAQAPKR